VTPEGRERIFDQEIERDGGLRTGAGLAHGVAMARQLAHANGGELRAVEPERANGRARFELSLPRAPERVADDTHPRGWRPDLGTAARGRRQLGEGGPAIAGQPPSPGGIALSETVPAERLDR
jgi:hypothetical protein